MTSQVCTEIISQMASVPLGATALLRRGSTADWWTTLFGSKRANGWRCDATHAMLETEHREVTHTCLDGSFYSGDRPVYTGLLHIPDNDLDEFKKTAAEAHVRGIPLYINEIASQRHPVYLDLDMSSILTARYLELIYDVIKNNGVGDTLERSDLMCRFHSLYMVDPEKREGLSAVMHDMFPFEGDRCPWTWLNVIEACMTDACLLSADGTDSPLLNLQIIPPEVLNAIMVLFLMAAAIEVQSVVRTFYPRIAPNDLNWNTFVLCNYDGVTARPAPIMVRKDKSRHIFYKFSAHIVIRGILVDDDISLWIWQAVVDRFSSRYSRVPGGTKPEDFWGQAFDGGVYSTTGGLRMPFSYKASNCTSCGNVAKQRKSCSDCRFTGKFHHNRYHGPLAIVGPKGTLETLTVTLERWFQSREYVMLLSTVRIHSKYSLTPGVDLTGKKEPSGMLRKEQVDLQTRFGSESKVRKLVARTVSERGWDEDDTRLGHVLGAINSFERIFETVNKPPSERCRIHLAPDDSRYREICKFLPPFCGAHFHPCFGSMEVKSATIITDRENGEPMCIVVCIKGDAADRCMNRVVDVYDHKLGPDVAERVRGRDLSKIDDLDGIPGRHTRWCGSVYFMIKRENTGSVTQKCHNRQPKASRRSARAIGPGEKQACCVWKGETRQIPSEGVLVVQRMFYTEEQRTDKACKEMVLHQASRLAKRYRSGKVPAIGPTDKYAEYARKAINFRRKRKTNPEYGDIYNEVTEDDDSSAVGVLPF